MINLKNIDELIIAHDIITTIMTKYINWISQFYQFKPICKNLEGKRQKNRWWSLEPTRRERKAKNYLKSNFEKVQFCLFKNLIHEFRSVENQPQLVETDRDSLSKILKNFDRSKNRMDRSN